MASVYQLAKVLDRPPNVVRPDGIATRTFVQPDDIPSWLALRQAAFARQSLGVRSWDPADFATEIAGKPWWRPDCCWLAYIDSDAGSLDSPAGLIVGSVTLAQRTGRLASRPAVHWLMVRPGWRHRGIAQMLLAQLEQECWQQGSREVVLETHAAWSAAVRLYEAAGYRTATSVEGAAVGDDRGE